MSKAKKNRTKKRKRQDAESKATKPWEYQKPRGSSRVSLELDYAVGKPLVLSVNNVQSDEEKRNRKRAKGSSSVGAEETPDTLKCTMRDTNQAACLALDILRMGAMWDLASGTGRLVDPGLTDSDAMIESLKQHVCDDLDQTGDNIRAYMELMLETRRRAVERVTGGDSKKRPKAPSSVDKGDWRNRDQKQASGL